MCVGGGGHGTEKSSRYDLGFNGVRLEAPLESLLILEWSYLQLDGSSLPYDSCGLQPQKMRVRKLETDSLLRSSCERHYPASRYRHFTMPPFI